jgi:hypothetical protein
MALEDVVRKHHVPGVALAVVSGDAIVTSAAAGLAEVGGRTAMSTDGACNWFSMTKIATATGAMMLADRGWCGDVLFGATLRCRGRPVVGDRTVDQPGADAAVGYSG